MQADAMQMDALGEPGTWPDDIWQLGQSDIEKTLDYSFPLYIDDSKLLKVYTFWLVKQIPKLGLKSSFDSSDIIRNGCNFLSARNYDKGVVISAFSKHQPHYLKEYPDGRRQFNYTRRDIEINYKKVSVSASSSSKPSPAQCVCGNSGIGDVFQSTLKISPTSQEENADTDTMDRTKNQLRKLLGMLKQPDSEKWSFDVTPKPSEPAKGVPPAGYVCKRCGIPGHYIQHCNTNGNPTYDGPTPKGYACRHCGAVETHFISACPKRQSLSPTTSIKREAHEEPSRRARKPKSPPRCRSPEPMEGVVSSAGGNNTPGKDTFGDSIEHMSEERIRYIREHTDRYRPDSGDCSGKSAGRGPRRSGANTDPLGRRRQLDSYRPNSSKKRSSMTRDTKAAKEEPDMSHRSRYHSSEGRLSPWDDIQRPPKKRRRDDNYDGGLPWDEPQTTPRALKTHESNVSTTPQISKQNCWSTQNDFDEDDIEEGQIIPDSPDGGEEAMAATNTLLESLEREVLYGLEYQDSGATFYPDPTGNNDYSSHFTASSPFGYDEQSCLQAAEKMSEDGEDVKMIDAPYGVARSDPSISGAQGTSYPPANLIKPLQTLKPLLRDPPYDPFVLNLFRGREQDQVYVNVVHYKTAMDMYEDEDATCTASQMSNLRV